MQRETKALNSTSTFLWNGQVRVTLQISNRDEKGKLVKHYGIFQQKKAKQSSGFSVGYLKASYANTHRNLDAFSPTETFK